MGSRRTTARRAEKGGADLDPTLRELLDHVARELAEEYMRLLREGATSGPRQEGDRPEGGER
jgi:hypothetical protein